MKKQTQNLIAVKKQLAEKYTRLALLSGSKIKRGSFERKAKAYANQATTLELCAKQSS